MVRTLRVAVVGAGPAGQAHAFAYRNATMADDLRDVSIERIAIIDPNVDQARAIADRYGFTTAEADIDRIVNDSSIDAVSVAVPNHLSAGIVEKLIAAGKHVLAEKPLGRSADEAARLAELARSTNVVTAVGFSYRRIPAVAAARQLIRSGRIGTPYFARVHFFADYALDPTSPMNWRFEQTTSGGGSLMDIGTHAIDTAEFLLGDVVEVSSADLVTTIAERPLAGEPNRMGVVDTDDTAAFSLRHTGGSNSSIVTSRIAAGLPCELGVEVFASKGHVRFDFSRLNELSVYEVQGSDGWDGPRRVISGPASPGFVDVMPMAFRGNTAGYGEAFIAQTQTFVRSIVNSAPMDTDFSAAARTMQVAQAVFDAHHSKKPVALP